MSPERRRRTTRLAVAAGAALLLAPSPPPAAAFSGGTSGATASCTAGFLGSDQKDGAVRDVTGQASVNCPAPGPGQGSASSGPNPGTPGSPQFTFQADCSFVVNEPVTYTETNLGGGRPAGSLPFIGPLPFMFFSPPARTMIGVYDLFVPWKAIGWYDQNGNCVPKPGTVYWNQVCVAPFPSPGVNGCVIRVPHPIGNGPAPPPLGGLNLQGQVKGQVQPGAIASLPTISGLVGIPTCFAVNGMNTFQPRTLEIALWGQPDPSGRRVYYIFRIEIDRTGIVWDFGDGSAAEIPPADQCLSRLAGQVVTAHQYGRYSGQQDFQVTAVETYSAHVTEFWDDSGGTQSVDLGNGGINPFTVTAGPYPIQVLQEEGVPIGSVR